MSFTTQETYEGLKGYSRVALRWSSWSASFFDGHTYIKSIHDLHHVLHQSLGCHHSLFSCHEKNNNIFLATPTASFILHQKRVSHRERDNTHTTFASFPWARHESRLVTVSETQTSSRRRIKSIIVTTKALKESGHELCTKLRTQVFFQSLAFFQCLIRSGSIDQEEKKEEDQSKGITRRVDDAMKGRRASLTKLLMKNLVRQDDFS